VGDETEDLELAWSERVQSRWTRHRRCRVCGEFLDDPTGDRRGQDALAGRHGFDRFDELFRRCALEQETTGSGAERAEDVFVDVEGRQDDHPWCTTG
jgi:hypothetical protein